MSDLYTRLTPRLVVPDAEAALAFYEAVFEAKRGMMIKDADGLVVHAELDVAGLRMSLTEASPHNSGLAELGGSPVILTLVCDDPDGIEAKAVANGATVVFAVDDRYYGTRDGRFVDPAGHVWLVTKMLEEHSAEEIQRRSDSQ